MHVPIPVELTPAEMWVAATVGVMRQTEAIKLGLRQTWGNSGKQEWQDHIEGAAGECAVAKATGLYWGCWVNTFKTVPDVGPFEVRMRPTHGYDLIVRPDDKDDSIFILVTGKMPKYQVVGWIKAADAKKERFLKTYTEGRPKVFFVPQAELRDMKEISHG